MLYKPTYCSNCGDKIERTEWHFWTNRRFCEVCEIDLKFFAWIPQAILGIGIFLCLIGIGGYLKTDDKQLAVAGNVNLTKSAQTNLNQTQIANNSNSQIVVQHPKQEQSPTVALKQNQAVVQKVNKDREEASVSEPVYFCGAETKKGTPCSRKVKGGGRCWQHEGQAAMLPPEKLLASQ